LHGVDEIEDVSRVEERGVFWAAHVEQFLKIVGVVLIII
jgi:hypothetical protein